MALRSMMMQVVAVAALSVVVLIAAAAAGGSPLQPDASEVEFAYIDRSQIWTFQADEEKVIHVCWDSPPLLPREQSLVKSAIKDSWGRYSGIDFRGWGACAERNSGIRIKVSDEQPHVKRLGKSIDGQKDGMVLNFTFEKWSPSCRTNEERRNFCIRSIAVHEFGHALGFAHEHNRADRDIACTEEHQGSNGTDMITPYDPHSVMNYCNIIYNNGGTLSDLDIAAVQKIYRTFP